MHVQFDEGYQRAADLLTNFREELARRRKRHAELVLALDAGTIAAGASVTQTPAEAAALLLAGELPGTTADALAGLQQEEELLRRQLEAMAPSLEQRLADGVELARVRARRAAIESDPRTGAIRERWAAAEKAVRAALELENEQRKELVRGAFGTPEYPRPAWLMVNLLD